MLAKNRQDRLRQMRTPNRNSSDTLAAVCAVDLSPLRRSLFRGDHHRVRSTVHTIIEVRPRNLTVRLIVWRRPQQARAAQLPRAADARRTRGRRG